VAYDEFEDGATRPCRLLVLQIYDDRFSLKPLDKPEYGLAPFF
jgi:hypothetical protein